MGFDSVSTCNLQSCTALLSALEAVSDATRFFGGGDGGGGGDCVDDSTDTMSSETVTMAFKTSLR